MTFSVWLGASGVRRSLRVELIHEPRITSSRTGRYRASQAPGEGDGEGVTEEAGSLRRGPPTPPQQHVPTTRIRAVSPGCHSAVLEGTLITIV